MIATELVSGIGINEAHKLLRRTTELGMKAKKDFKMAYYRDQDYRQ